MEEGLDDGRGGGGTEGDRGGRSGLSVAGGGGGGRGGVRGGGESRSRGFLMSSVVLLLVSGRLWVRMGVLGCSLAGTVCAGGSEVTDSVKSWGSEVVMLEITNDPPATEENKQTNKLSMHD